MASRPVCRSSVHLDVHELRRFTVTERLPQLTGCLVGVGVPSDVDQEFKEGIKVGLFFTNRDAEVSLDQIVFFCVEEFTRS